MDAFLAVTQGDNRNYFASQMAKEVYGVRRVLCRIYDPVREQIFRELGLETFSPTSFGAQIMVDMLLSGPRREAIAMYVLVAGGGKVGFYLAEELIEATTRSSSSSATPPRAAAVTEELGDNVMHGDSCEATTLDAPASPAPTSSPPLPAMTRTTW